MLCGFLLLTCVGCLAPEINPLPPTSTVKIEATATQPPTATALLPTLTAPPPTETPTTVPTPEPTPCGEQGSVVEATYPSAIQGPTRNYRIYLPPCYGADGRMYPTVYLFHGNTRGDWEWDVLGVDESAETLISTNEIPPLLIVMPDGRTLSDISSGGEWSYEQVVIDELIPHIEATYCADTIRAHRAIGGISRGGYWAFEIAFRYPHLFASVGGHSAALADISTDETINPIYTGLSAELSGLRIAFDYGEYDWYIRTTEPLHNHFDTIGLPHEWIIRPDGGHNDDYWVQHIDDYLRWYAEFWSHNRQDYVACDLRTSFLRGTTFVGANE